MPAALRYTFEYDDAAVRMLRRSKLDKQTAPSYKWEGADGESGFWVELRDASQQVLYRRVMDDPAFRYEAPLDDNGTLRTPTAVGRKGTFSVVVPDLPQARTLMVWASRPPEAAAVPILTQTVDGAA
jgi:hypothetical protein